MYHPCSLYMACELHDSCPGQWQSDTIHTHVCSVLKRVTTIKTTRMMTVMLKRQQHRMADGDKVVNTTILIIPQSAMKQES